MSMTTLGIIAGNGVLPKALAQSAVAQGRSIFILGFEHATNITPLTEFPHAMIRIGAMADCLQALRNAGVNEVVMAGHFKRPSLLTLKPDVTATRLLGKIGKAFFAGDNALLSALVSFLEEEGFCVIGAEAVMGGLLAEAQCYTQQKPDTWQSKDITLGIQAAKALGARDIGQAVVVLNEMVMAEETAAGTAAMLEGLVSAQLQGGVLVKVAKPQQEKRADLPAIGPDTILQVQAAGLKGIAVEAGGALLLERERLVALADTHGLFVLGI